MSLMLIVKPFVLVIGELLLIIMFPDLLLQCKSLNPICLLFFKSNHLVNAAISYIITIFVLASNQSVYPALTFPLTCVSVSIHLPIYVYLYPSLYL